MSVSSVEAVPNVPCLMCLKLIGAQDGHQSAGRDGEETGAGR